MAVLRTDNVMYTESTRFKSKGQYSVTPDDLTPEERIEVQSWFVRAWHARRRRALFGQIHRDEARKTYDMGGRLTAVNGRSVAQPRVSTRDEDRA